MVLAVLCYWLGWFWFGLGLLFGVVFRLVLDSDSEGLFWNCFVEYESLGLVWIVFQIVLDMFKFDLIMRRSIRT